MKGTELPHWECGLVHLTVPILSAYHDFEMLLAKSFAFHLLAPYAAQLGLGFLLVDYCSPGGVVLVIALGGWIALLVSIPFGVLHVLQTIHFAQGRPSSWKQFLVGFMNPSLALLTIAGVMVFAPDFISGLG